MLPVQHFEHIEVRIISMSNLTRKEEQILLAINQLGDEAYLITIREMIKEYTGKYYSVGTVYAPLNRLAVQGFLESYYNRERTFSSKKPITFYRLTAKGRAALSELSQLHDRMWSGFSIKTEEK